MRGLIVLFFFYTVPQRGSASDPLSDELQKLQNRAACVITRSSLDISSNLLLDQVRWNCLSTIRDK